MGQAGCRPGCRARQWRAWLPCQLHAQAASWRCSEQQVQAVDQGHPALLATVGAAANSSTVISSTSLMFCRGTGLGVSRLYRRLRSVADGRPAGVHLDDDAVALARPPFTAEAASVVTRIRARLLAQQHCFVVGVQAVIISMMRSAADALDFVGVNLDARSRYVGIDERRLAFARCTWCRPSNAGQAAPAALREALRRSGR